MAAIVGIPVWLIVILAALILYACVAFRRGRWVRGIALGGLIAVGGIILMSWSEIRVHQPSRLQIADQTFHAVPHSQAIEKYHDRGRRVAPAAISPGEAASLEALWDQLHQVRIDLSEEATPVAESDGPDAAVESAVEAPERPAWVDRPAQRVGEVYQQKLSAGPWEEVADCHRELEAKLRVAVAQRIEQLAGKLEGKSRVSVPPLEKMGFGIHDVIRDLCSEEFVETITTESFADMKQVHVLMEFTPDDDQRLLEGWQGYRRRDRLAAVSLVGLLAVGVIGLAYGLLCIDTWTRGYYTKRLLLGVPAAIIMFVILIS